MIGFPEFWYRNIIKVVNPGMKQRCTRSLLCLIFGAWFGVDKITSEALVSSPHFLSLKQKKMLQATKKKIKY